MNDIIGITQAFWKDKYGQELSAAEAEEMIIYNMTAYRYHGTLVGFCPAGVSVACILNYKNVCTEPRHIKEFAIFCPPHFHLKTAIILIDFKNLCAP